jgi:uncharacterized membrane protein
MRLGRSEALAVSCLTGAIAVVTGNVAVPQALRIAVGVMMVLVLPGFATVCIVLSKRPLSLGECLLASLGISLAIAVCLSVLLAATPIGLTTSSLATALGCGTAILSIYAWRRTRLGRDVQVSGESTSKMQP